jgi:F-box-like
MNPKRVPVEVLEGIFAYIDDKRTMYNLLLTCKLFSSLITPRLYQQVPMVDDDPRKVPDEPVINTIHRSLTKLLESLTPTKAGHIKLLQLDPFIQTNAFDIFDHFTGLESLVLYFPYNHQYKGCIQLHPQLLKVRNLAIRIVTHAIEDNGYSRDAFGDDPSAAAYLRSFWDKWKKGHDDTKAPPDLHLIFDTCIGSAPNWSGGDLDSSEDLLDFMGATVTRTVHTNAAPTEDWNPHHFDESQFLGYIFHYYPTSYWNSGRATSKLWDSPDCRNEGYKLRHWVACCVENFEEDWCRGPLPDDYFKQFLPPGWTGEEPVFHFHATHKILLELFRPPPYFISNGAFHQALGGVDNAIRLLSRTPTAGILFNLEYPIFRRELSEPELNKMYIEIRELLVPPTENETEGSYDCIDESWMAVLKETFVPLTQEMWVNTCPEIYDSQYESHTF